MDPSPEESFTSKLQRDLPGYGSWMDDVSVNTICTCQNGSLLTFGSADFNNLHAFEEYLRGYRILRTFFAQHL